MQNEHNKWKNTAFVVWYIYIYKNNKGVTSNASGMHTAGMPSCDTKDFSTLTSSEVSPDLFTLKLFP